MMHRKRLTRYAWLSIFTAVITIALKAIAYGVTGSVGLLSDALESGVNLLTAVIALITLFVAALPPDDEHAHGHSKAEYFSCGLEGSLILAAAVSIGVAAGRRFFDPHPLAQLDVGLIVSLAATLCNGATALILLRVGRQQNSITLRANANHLLTDVWTSVGVVLGIGAIAITGWQWLDPVIALIVALHIIRPGIRLVRTAISGLMDSSLPPDELEQVTAVLNGYCQPDVQYHALRTRQSGAQRFVTVHIQVPGTWSVHQGHALLEAIELDLRQKLPSVSVVTHLEPIEDPVSWADIPLIRQAEEL